MDFKLKYLKYKKKYLQYKNKLIGGSIKSNSSIKHIEYDIINNKKQKKIHKGFKNKNINDYRYSFLGGRSVGDPSFFDLYTVENMYADIFHDFKRYIGPDTSSPVKYKFEGGGDGNVEMTNVEVKEIPYNTNLELGLMDNLYRKFETEGAFTYAFYNKAADGSLDYIEFSDNEELKVMNDTYHDLYKNYFTDANMQKPPDFFNSNNYGADSKVKNLCSTNNDDSKLTCSNSIDSAGLGQGKTFACMDLLNDYFKYLNKHKSGPNLHINDLDLPAEECASVEQKTENHSGGALNDLVYIIDTFYNLLLDWLEIIVSQEKFPQLNQRFLIAVQILRLIKFKDVDNSGTRLKFYVSINAGTKKFLWYISQNICATYYNKISIIMKKVEQRKGKINDEEGALIKTLSELQPFTELLAKVNKTVQDKDDQTDFNMAKGYAILFLKFLGDLSHILLLFILYKINKNATANSITLTNDRCLFHNFIRIITKYKAPSQYSFGNTMMIATGTGETPQWMKGGIIDDKIKKALSTSNTNYLCAVVFKKLTEEERVDNYFKSVFTYILYYLDLSNEKYTVIEDILKEETSVRKKFIEDNYTKIKEDYLESKKEKEKINVAESLNKFKNNFNKLRTTADVKGFTIDNRKMHLDEIPEKKENEKYIQLWTLEQLMKAKKATKICLASKFTEPLPNLPRSGPPLIYFKEGFLGLVVSSIINYKTQEGGQLYVLIDKSLNFDTLNNLKDFEEFLNNILFWVGEYINEEGFKFGNDPWMNCLFLKINSYLQLFKSHSPKTDSEIELFITKLLTHTARSNRFDESLEDLIWGADYDKNKEKIWTKVLYGRLLNYLNESMDDGESNPKLKQPEIQQLQEDFEDLIEDIKSTIGEINTLVEECITKTGFFLESSCTTLPEESLNIKGWELRTNSFVNSYATQKYEDTEQSLGKEFDKNKTIFEKKNMPENMDLENQDDMDLENQDDMDLENQ